MIAELPDGTELEFPDDTPDDVVDRVVKQHLGQSKPQATWGETLQGGVSLLAKNMGLGGLGIAGGVDEIGKAMYEPIRRTLSALGTEVQVPDSGIGETMAETKKFYDEADPTLTKQMTTGQRVTKAGTQLLSLAGGPVGLAAMLAGGTTDEAMRMLDEGMPLDKTQTYMAADAALNTGAVAFGGVGKRPITQAVSLGAGNMAGDEASHWLANQFRESEGLKLNERDNIDRAISFGMGAVPGYIAQRAAANVEATRKP